MSTEADLEMFKSCQEEQASKPVETANDLVTNQSAGMAAVLEALNLGTCTTALVAGAALFPPFALGATSSTGCEQVSAISSAMDASQKVFQCAMTKLSTTVDKRAEQTLTVEVSITNVNLTNCNIVIRQTAGLAVASFTKLSDDIKVAINASLENTMDSFIKAIQEETKSGLFGTSDGQKAVDSMSKNVNNAIANKSFLKSTQAVLEEYANTGSIKLTFTGLNILNNVQSGNAVLTPCIEVTQDFMMQYISQTIVERALEIAMEGDATNLMKDMLDRAQIKDITGVSIPDFGVMAIMIIIIIVVLAMTFSKKPGANGAPPQPALSGPAGKILGIILMVLGFVLIIAGIILMLIKKKNKVLGGLLIAGGAILGIIGIVMYVRARSQQTLFEQKLKLAQTNHPTEKIVVPDQKTPNINTVPATQHEKTLS